MATEKKPTMLRLHEEMHEKLRYLAFLEHRSVNAEIEYVLSLYIAEHEKKFGTIFIPTPNEEK